MSTSPTARFAALTLAYHQEDYLEPCLRSLAGHCGGLFVMYSELPFTRYNPRAREEGFASDATGAILAALQPEIPGLEVIEGVWEGEDEMRNEGRSAALASGFDYLLIVEADEFYGDGVLERVVQSVLDSPGPASWWAKMRVPFKYVDWVIDREDEYLPVALDLHSGMRFDNRRIPGGSRMRLAPELLCFNMGFVLSDERMLEKTRTWSHAHQLPAGWYRDKWLNWRPSTRDLHTRVPELWPCTRPMDPAELPAVLRGRPQFRRYDAE